MKKTTEIKYPNSVNLFQFCRRVLDHKFGGIRVIDQDVGQILGFDPADCSHWKKGKKNIRSIQAMKAIAEHLGLDERLVVDVADGELGEEEAFYEYSGYGHFDIDAKIMEAAKKEFYRRHANAMTRDKETEFKARFDANEPLINEVVKKIHAQINFSEAPLYLPEVVNSFPNLKLVPKDEIEGEAGSIEIKVEKQGEITTIKYLAGSEMRPFVRYRIAKALAAVFLSPEGDGRLAELGEYGLHVRDVQSNLFASKLLAPATLMRTEMAQINVAKDIVSQLADIFWVSKAFMNRRLKDFLENSPEI